MRGDTSLVAQWLKLCTFNAGGPGSIPGQGTISLMLQLRSGAAQKNSIKKKKKRWDIQTKEQNGIWTWATNMLSLHGEQTECSGPLRNVAIPRALSVQFSSVTQSRPTLCNPMNHSTPGLPVHHQLTEFTQTHVHRVSDAIQPSHPLSSPSPPAPNPSQNQGLFQWVKSSHEVAQVLEF